MTDSDLDLDRRLQAAGERWRAAEDNIAPRPIPDRRRPWLLIASAAVVVAALVAGGVTLWARSDSSGPTEPTAASIGTSTWHARSFSRGPTYDLVALDGRATLTFADGHVTGSDGCNAIDAAATIDRDTITIGDYAQTQIGCAGADVVDRFMTGTVRYSVTAVALVLTKPGVGTLFLTHGATPSRATKKLTGAWVLTGTQTTSKDGSTGSGTSVSPTGDASRLVLTSASFTYTARCYIIRGGATSNGSVLTLRSVRLVPHSCPPLPRGQSSAAGLDSFARTVLTGTVDWQIDDNQLTITRGTRGLTFERAK